MIHEAASPLSRSTLALVAWPILDEEGVLVPLVPRLEATFCLHTGQ